MTIFGDSLRWAKAYDLDNVPNTGKNLPGQSGL